MITSVLKCGSRGGGAFRTLLRKRGIHFHNIDVVEIYERLHEKYLQSSSDRMSTESKATTEVKNGVFKSIYQPHLSEKDVAAGLKLGVLMTGKLEVAAFDSSIAKVILADHTHVLIQNNLDRNRALHNDVVVVRLHPKSQWASAPPGAVFLTKQGLRHLEKGKGEGDSEDESSDDEGSIVLKSKGCDKIIENDKTNDNTYPTGMIVSVKKRAIVELIASIPNRGSANTLATASGNEYMLAIPIDKKFPKIRISTRQRQKLEGKRIFVTLDSWTVDSLYPMGHFTRVIGDATAGLDVLLYSSGTPFVGKGTRESNSRCTMISAYLRIGDVK